MPLKHGRQQLLTHFPRKQRPSHLAGAQHGFVRSLRFEPLEDRRLLAVVTVGNTLDVVNGDTSSIANLIANNGGDGISLREAITAANNTAGADTVLFDHSLSGQSIAINSQLPTITDSLTITGLGADLLTIDAGNGADNTFATGDGYRIFNITDGTSALINVEISGLTLTGGDAPRGVNGSQTAGSSGASGGAILNMENLTITASAISGNAAGGGGTGGVINSEVLGGLVSLAYDGGAGGNGGGIFSSAGSLLVRSSTISGNMTGRGGDAGTPSGTAVITMGANGGNGGLGGGLFVSGGSLQVEQSTVSGNATGGGGTASSGNFGSGTPGLRGTGGGIFNNATTSVLHSTLTQNTARSGGGILNNGGTANVTGSIIAGNAATSSANVAGTLAIDTFNLIDVDPLLAPLADNGGPTLTHALLLGSPAINAGDPAFVAPPAFDQRGAPFARVLGGTIDIGAIEFAPLAVVNNTSDVDDGDPLNGMTSLREAIALANAHPGGDLIEFDAALSGQTIALGGTELAITDAITIDASMLSNNVTINAGGQSRVLFIDDPGVSDESFDVTLNGITFTGGRTTANSQHGGAIWSAQFGTLTLNDSIVTGNHTEGIGALGGGIRSSGDVVLNQSTVSENSTLGDDAAGGGIHSSRAVLLQESTVTGNSTAGSNAYGGGFVADSTSTITESIISGNRTTGPNANGGGFVFDGGTVTLMESAVSGNRTEGAGSLGGGVYATGPLNLVDSTVDGNYTVAAGAHGGGIYSTFPLSISGSTISGNHTTGQSARGGAVFAKNGSLTIDESSVVGNYTSGDFASAGAIYTNGGTFEITRSTITGNRTIGDRSYGGAIQAVLSDVTLTESTVSVNTTSNFRAHGGAMWISGSLIVSQSTVSGNTTTGLEADGGAIRTFSNTPVTLFQSTFFDNHTAGTNANGGGIFVINLTQDLPIDVNGSIFAGNTASGTGNDLLPDPDSGLVVNYSLIGTGMTPSSGGNNVSMDNPQLGPLADNGGHTKTHALLPGSPAIDAGDPTFDPADPDGDPMTDDAVPFDQRGEPFVRVFDGDGVDGERIDIGAFEFIPGDAIDILFGDYNHNGVVDAADYTIWRDMLGQSGLAPYSGADGSGDGTIGPEDYEAWRSHFGQTLPQPGAGSAVPLASTATPAITNLVADAQTAKKDVTFDVAGRRRPPITVSLQTIPSNGLLKVLRRPIAIPRLSSQANMDAGLLAWLAARNDSRPIDHKTRRESSLADRTGKAECDTGLHLVDGVFGSLLADMAVKSPR